MAHSGMDVGVSDERDLGCVQVGSSTTFGFVVKQRLNQKQQGYRFAFFLQHIKVLNKQL